MRSTTKETAAARAEWDGSAADDPAPDFVDDVWRMRSSTDMVLTLFGVGPGTVVDSDEGGVAG